MSATDHFPFVFTAFLLLNGLKTTGLGVPSESGRLPPPSPRVALVKPGHCCSTPETTAASCGATGRLAVVPVEEEQREGAHHQEEEHPHSEARVVFDGLSDVFVTLLDVLGCPDNELVDAVNVGFLL